MVIPDSTTANILIQNLVYKGQPSILEKLFSLNKIYLAETLQLTKTLKQQYPAPCDNMGQNGNAKIVG